MNGTNGLIVRFLLGVAAPVAVILLSVCSAYIFASLPPIVAVLGTFRWVIALVAVLILLRMGRSGRGFFKRQPTENEYGITPPTCRSCGYDLRASPENCPECGTPVDQVDGTIVRYLMTLRRRDMIDANVARKS